MPAFEFFGFTNKERDQIIREISPSLKNISIANLITFIVKDNDESKVINLSGEEKPFIRVSTRTEERAIEIENALKDFPHLKVVFFLVARIKQNETKHCVTAHAANSPEKLGVTRSKCCMN
ncbi:MAG: hypothetical protein WCF65_01960 [Parachlamydiaceae bacterium]